MNDIHLMKGQGTPLITIFIEDLIVDCLTYADGSVSISRNGQLMGLWEANECENCVQSLMQFLPKSPNGMTVLQLSQLTQPHRLTQAPPSAN